MATSCVIHRKGHLLTGSLTPRLRPAAALIVSLTVALTAPRAAVAASGSPRSMVLSPADAARYFGDSFKQLLGETVSPKTVAVALSSSRLPGVQYQQHGFRTGYLVALNKAKGLTVFKNGKLSFKPGVAAVTSAVFQFKDASGPRWEFGYAKAHRAKSSPALQVQLKKVSGLGDEATLQRTATKINAQLGTFSGLSLSWRHGAYTAILTVAGYGTLPLKSLMTAARAMDGRITKSG